MKIKIEKQVIILICELILLIRGLCMFLGSLQFSQWNRLPPQSQSFKFNFREQTVNFQGTADIHGDHLGSNKAGFISVDRNYAPNQSLKGSELIPDTPVGKLAKGEEYSTACSEANDKSRSTKTCRKTQQKSYEETRQRREASKKLPSSYNTSPNKPPFKCDQCGKIFKTKYTLTIHLKMPSHTGAKPFVCAICGKGFRLSSTLCRHKIIHTSEKPHKCHICDKAFNRSSTLKTHIRTHSELKEFVCDICGKGFHQKGNLRNHVLIHTGEKPYHCNLCEKAFNKLSNLKFHMHIHTDNAPYRCRYCKNCFTRRCDLKLHIAECSQQK